MFTISLRVVVLVAVCLALPSCDLPDNDARPPDPPVYQSPAVVSTTPANLATGVPTTMVVRATFSQVMDPASVTPANFTLTSAGGPVTGAVALSANGLEAFFTPSAPLANSVTYTANLKPGCRNMTGQGLPADHVWTFTTGIPVGNWQWSAPALLETSAAAIQLNYSGPEIALDDAENACAVWRQSDGAAYRIYASRSVQGGAWEAPVAISVGGGITPLVAFEGPGQVLAVWSEGLTMRYARAGMTGAWQAPQSCATSPQWTMIPLKLLFDSAGNALLFYNHDQQGSQSDNMFVVRLDTTSGWESPIALPLRSGYGPRFAMDPSGFATMVWPYQGGINARRFIPGTGWTGNEVVDPVDLTRPNTEPNVAMDRAGTCLVVWLKRIAGGSIYDLEIYSCRVTASQPWPGGDLGPATAGQRVTALNPALSPDGTVALTWVNQLGWRCWASLQSPAGAWSAALAIDMNTPNHTVTTGWPFFAGNGRIAVLGSEPIYIPGSEHSALWITEYNPSTGWATPSRYRTAVGYMNNQRLAVDSVGRAAAVWLESEAPAFTGNNSVYWGRFR